MREITVALPGKSYPILIGGGAVDQLGQRLRAAGREGAVALMEDAGVVEPWGDRAARSLAAAGYRAARLVVPSGEESKSLARLGAVYSGLAAAGLDRKSTIVAVGGGVVGDLGGFAAATYLRGIAFVQVPTTLLAQVDASVGGKTGIDLPEGKNLVGAFHQPELVLADLDALETLPSAQLAAGLAEVVKYGVIADPEFFAFLETGREAILARDPAALAAIVARSCEIKAAVVSSDERETGLRAILNYGHTVGHAVEAVAGYGSYLHGEAVAIGMAAAGALAERLGWLAPADGKRITRLLRAFGLPTRLREPLDEAALLQAMRLDKKSLGGELRFILARAIGRVETTPVSEALAGTALAAIRPLAGPSPPPSR